MEWWSIASARFAAHRRRRPILAITGLLAAASSAWLFSLDAIASPPLLVALTYKVDSALRDCPSESDFRRAVQNQVGYDPFRDDAAERVLVDLQAIEHTARGSIVWSDASGQQQGERHFASPGSACTGVALKVSFAVAVQIQLFESRARPGGAPAAQPSSDSAPATSADAAPTESAPSPIALDRRVPAGLTPDHPEEESRGEIDPRSSAPASPSPFRLLVGLGPQADFGIAPGLMAEGRLFVLARRAAWSIEIGGAIGAPVTAQEASGMGFREYVIFATLGICGHLDPFALCGLGRAGQIRVEGFGVDIPASPTGPIAQAGVRLAAQRAMGAFAGALHVDILWTLTRPTVTLNDVGVWTTPAASFLVGFDAMGSIVQ